MKTLNAGDQTAIIHTYGKRWDVGVFFKMIKQHLSLAKEVQCRDYDALIGHTSIVFMRYMFLAYHCRLSADQRSFGDLFHACCDEIRDISFLEALLRVVSLVEDRMRAKGAYCKETLEAFFLSSWMLRLLPPEETEIGHSGSH